MDLGLRGKVAIVTGGSKGIGRASALALGREGAAVAICARNAGALEETAAELRRLEGGRTVAVAADLTRAEAVKEGSLDASASSAGWTSWSTTPAARAPASF
jgi:3-oxoacyl-[acyl-carrier protein] reductase